MDFEVGSLACSSERVRGNTTFSTGRLIKSKATRHQRVAFFVSVSLSKLLENILKHRPKAAPLSLRKSRSTKFWAPRSIPLRPETSLPDPIKAGSELAGEPSAWLRARLDSQKGSMVTLYVQDRPRRRRALASREE